MERFPLLNTYRGLLQVAAALIIIIGFLLGISLAVGDTRFEYNDNIGRTEETRDFSVGTFIVIFGLAAILAIFVLIAAELVKLALFVEDHLYHIRYGQNPVQGSGSTTAPIKAYTPSSSFWASAAPAATDSSPEEDEHTVKLFAQAREAQLQDEFEKAIVLFSRVIARNPYEHYRAYQYRSECYRRLGRNEKADNDWTIYLQLAAEQNPPSNTDM